MLESISGQTKITYLEYGKDCLLPSGMLYLFFKFMWVWHILRGLLYEFTCFFYLSFLFHGSWHRDIFSVTCNIRLFLHCSSVPMKSLWPVWDVVTVYLSTWHIAKDLDLQEHLSENLQSGKDNFVSVFHWTLYRCEEELSRCMFTYS
jgi:hypothetical protein